MAYEQMEIISEEEIVTPKSAYEQIRPYIDAVLERFNFSPSHIVANQIADGLSIRYNIGRSIFSVGEDDEPPGVRVIVRLTNNTKGTRASIPLNRLKFYNSEELPLVETMSKAPKERKIDILPDRIRALAEAVCNDIADFLLAYPSDIACCGLYEKCSDAGSCLQVDQNMAAGCYYKKNLMQGRVFYGKNANLTAGVSNEAFSIKHDTKSKAIAADSISGECDTALEFSEYRGYMKKEEMHKSLNTLIGMLTGIAADGFVIKSESDEVQNWYALHRGLMNQFPFNHVLPVLDCALTDGYIDEEETQDILWLCENFADKHLDTLYFDFTTSKIQQLHGILHGLIADGVLLDIEIYELSNWMEGNSFLKGSYPFDEIYDLLLKAREDGIITDDERYTLKAFFAKFVDTRESINVHESEVKRLTDEYNVQSIWDNCSEITFAGNVFCFTGASKLATKEDFANIVQENGGKFTKGLTMKTKYLVVCADGNPCWAFSCYGRKVEKAKELKKSGQDIKIIHEDAFWAALR